jgi:type I restriction enzyme S subunit
MGYLRSPPKWLRTSIGQTFEVYIGVTPSRPKSEYWDGDIPWVSSGEVAFCRIKGTREKITDSGLKNSSTNVHPVGTVLLGMIGEGKTRGQTAILDIEACNNQNAAAIRVSETDIVPEFIYSFLEKEYENTRRRGSGGNQPALNKSRVMNIVFPLPSIQEQKAIVNIIQQYLSNIESLLSIVTTNLTRADRLRQSILKKAFSGQLILSNGEYDPETTSELPLAAESTVDYQSKKR